MEHFLFATNIRPQSSDKFSMKWLSVIFILVACGNPNNSDSLIKKDYNLVKSFNYEQCGTLKTYDGPAFGGSTDYVLETNMGTIYIQPTDKVLEEINELSLPETKCFYSNEDIQGFEASVFNAEYMN
jgi:hypothetical protein